MPDAGVKDAKSRPCPPASRFLIPQIKNPEAFGLGVGMFRFGSNRPSRPPLDNNNRDAADGGYILGRVGKCDTHGVDAELLGRLGNYARIAGIRPIVKLPLVMREFPAFSERVASKLVRKLFRILRSHTPRGWRLFVRKCAPKCAIAMNVCAMRPQL
jgi:hypothetical protein